MSDRSVRYAPKPLAFLTSLGPAAWLLWAAVTGNLSANPLGDLTKETGVWALRFLCITLAITPLRRITGWNPWIKFRRMAGLFAFFYGTLHLLTYVIADRLAGLEFPDGVVAWTTLTGLATAVWDDISKRPYITVGFTAWATMVPLTLTSTAGMIRRLGGKLWTRLHAVVYVTAVLGVVHYWWLVRADVRRPLAYAIVVALLLTFRAYRNIRGLRPVYTFRGFDHMKNSNLLYWIVTGLMAAFMLLASIPDILKISQAVSIFEHLGYPGYLLPFLGIAKTLGVVVVLLPGVRKLKEWAFAGLVFDLVGALYSHLSVGDGPSVWTPAVIGLLLVSGSYLVLRLRQNADAASTRGLTVSDSSLQSRVA